MVLFQWDTHKSQLNLKKHGVSFQEAITAFFDLSSHDYFDILHSYTEDRFWLIGESSVGRILLVVYTFRRTSHEKKNYDYYRIVSARPANKEEIRIYLPTS
jgi:uncharacterized DUF497 family protein